MTKTPVLLCYDGSEDAKLAIERAADLFHDRNAIVLSVWRPAYMQLNAVWPGIGYAPDLDITDDTTRDFAAKLASEGAELANAAGLAAEPLTVEVAGPLWRAILDTADKYDVAVIAMGSRGLSGIKTLMMGSVSGSVVHHAHRPTLVVRHGVPTPDASETDDLAALASQSSS